MRSREQDAVARGAPADGQVAAWMLSGMGSAGHRAGATPVAEGRSRRLQRRSALLCGIALSACALGMVRAPNAQAASACTSTDEPNNAKSVYCTGVGTGGTFTAPGEMSLTLDDTVISDVNPGISAKGGTGLELTTTGSSSLVKGGTDGLYLEATGGDLTIHDTAPGTFTGYGDTGIKAISDTGKLTADDFKSTGDGLRFGVTFQGAQEVSAERFSGSGTNHGKGDGIVIKSDQASVSANHFSGTGSAQGEGAGVRILANTDIFLNQFSGSGSAGSVTSNVNGFSYGVLAISNGPGNIQADDFSGSGTADSGIGNAYGVRLLANNGDVSANNFSGTGTVTGTSHGYGISFAAKNDITADNFSGVGTVADGTGNGVEFRAGGDISANNFSGSGTVSRGSGIYIWANHDLTANNFSGTGTATASESGRGIEVVAGNTLTADDFSGIGESGAVKGNAGIYLEATGNLSALRFSGQGTQTAGGVGIAIVGYSSITADDFSGVGKSTGGDKKYIFSKGIDIIAYEDASLNNFSGQGTVSDGATNLSSMGVSAYASKTLTANNFSGQGTVSNQYSQFGNTGIYLSSNGKLTANNFSGAGSVSDASSDGSASYGIRIFSNTGVELNDFSGRGSVTGSAQGALDYGIYIGSYGTVTANNFSGSGTADSGTGIYIYADSVALNDFSGKAVSNGVGPAMGIDAFTDVEAKGFVGKAIAKEGTGFAISAGGNITFASGSGAVVSGDTYGFKAESTGGDGASIDVTAVGSFTGTTKDGINLKGPSVTLSATGAAIQGGVNAVFVSGKSVDLTFAASDIIGDADRDGVGSGIKAVAEGAAKVFVDGGTVVTGSGQSNDTAVISLSSDSGATLKIGGGASVTSWNAFTQAGLAKAAGDIVIAATGGAANITNSGAVIGVVSLTDKDDTFNNVLATNLIANTWYTIGTNSFGAGTDAVNNRALVVTALRGDVAETTAFNGLETFNNGDPTFAQKGLLTMIDETPGQIAWNGKRDLTYVSGVFNGVGNSTVGIDAALGAEGSTSDVLAIGGLDANGSAISGVVTTGQTALVVHDLGTNGGAFNLAGIKVVDVQDPAGVTYGKYDGSNQASFVISSKSDNYSSKFGGVIDKGLFFYDLAVIGNDQYLIGLPDAEAFQLPKLVTGAQSVWDVTTGVWLVRQADLRTYLQGSGSTLITKEGATSASSPSASITPGIWGKVVGDWGSREASNSFSAYGATYGFNTGYSQNTYGFMAGADFGKEGVGSSEGTLLFGVLGGYLTSSLSFDNAPNAASYTGGTVGAYATYLNANWFIDALFKADVLTMDYTAPTLRGVGYLGQSVDARNLGITIDTGYRLKWGETAFFEPLATLSYVNTTIGNLPLGAGTYADFGSNDSLRAAVGARVGLPTWNTATFRAETSLTGRFWYEFAGNNAVTLFNPGTPFVSTDNFDGAFGEVAATLNVFGRRNDWNGFTTASVKFGDSYTAGSAQAGVRYQW